jgi:hypothetical protein
MSIALISFIMIFIRLIEPHELTSASKIMMTDNLYAFALAVGSGVMLTVVTYLNR